MVVKALCFDVIGTAVDWRGTMLDLGSSMVADGDWAGLARDWAAYYAGDGFKSEADLRRAGRGLLASYGLAGRMTPAEVERFAGLWTRLRPWPDAVGGLARLRTRYRAAALTNCPAALMVELSRNAGLEWDAVLSAEAVGVKKPDPAVYLRAAEALALPPEHIMMVAAHLYDVRAARAQGFRTAYVQRREDRGAAADDAFDVVASDFGDLAAKLGA